MKDYRIALSLIVEPYDLKEMTVRSYMLELVAAVLIEEESFSGKRPFGESGWRVGIEEALIKGGFLKGKVNEPGYGCTFDPQDFKKLVRNLVKAM